MYKKDNVNGYTKNYINWLKGIFGNSVTNPYKSRNL